uniref:Secreted protein n=1 Tax=Schistocephalus solidus TaxID=70667 RepID=A0A183TSP1_SCHSO
LENGNCAGEDEDEELVENGHCVAPAASSQQINGVSWLVCFPSERSSFSQVIILAFGRGPARFSSPTLLRFFPLTLSIACPLSPFSSCLP